MNDAASILAARLADLWRNSRPLIDERLAALRATHEALTLNFDDVAARTRGREAAHKLSGVLGTFGLPRGSEIAGAIEGKLMDHDPLGPADLDQMAAHIAALDAVIASKNAG